LPELKIVEDVQESRSRAPMKGIMTRSGMFYLRVRRAGVQINHSLGIRDDGTRRSRAQAETVARLKLQAVAQNRIDVLRQSMRRTAYSTCGHAVDAYEAVCERMGEPRRGTVVQNVAAFWRILRTATGREDCTSCSLDVLTSRLASSYAEAVIVDPRNDSARRSVASNLRMARSLFTDAMLQEYRDRGLTLPDLSGFKSAKVTRTPAVQWAVPAAAEIGPVLDAGERLEGDLAKVWALARWAALRAGEIAAAKWDWFVPHNGVMGVMVGDATFTPKSGSAGWTPIPDDAWKKLEAMRAPGAVFVLSGTSPIERENLVEREFSGWMRSCGWTRRHAAHELRAWRINEWAEAHGEAIASLWARHASTNVTRRHYTDPISRAAASVMHCKP